MYAQCYYEDNDICNMVYMIHLRFYIEMHVCRHESSMPYLIVIRPILICSRCVNVLNCILTHNVFLMARVCLELVLPPNTDSPMWPLLIARQSLKYLTFAQHPQQKLQ